MKSNKTILAVLPCVIAAAALLLFVSSDVNAVTLIGFGSVGAILGFVALEYRLNWRSLVGR